MATQHRPAAMPSIPPVPAELDAMSRAWPSMADAILPLGGDAYETVKARFYMRERIAAGKAILV